MTVAIDELQQAMTDARAAIDRVNWLKDRLLDEYKKIRESEDQLDIYTEEEAAQMLKIERTHLADMRRRMDLPHCSFGNRPRYTREQLREICSMLEIGSGRGRSAGKRAA